MSFCRLVVVPACELAPRNATAWACSGDCSGAECPDRTFLFVNCWYGLSACRVSCGGGWNGWPCKLLPASASCMRACCVARLRAGSTTTSSPEFFTAAVPGMNALESLLRLGGAGSELAINSDVEPIRVECGGLLAACRSAPSPADLLCSELAQAPWVRIPRHPGHHSALMADSIPP